MPCARSAASASVKPGCTQAARRGRSAAGSSQSASAAPFVATISSSSRPWSAAMRARRGAVVGVARDVGVEGALQRVAQPGGRPARDDVDGVVGVARAGRRGRRGGEAGRRRGCGPPRRRSLRRAGPRPLPRSLRAAGARPLPRYLRRPSLSARPATTSSTRSACAAKRCVASPSRSSQARDAASGGRSPSPACSATTIAAPAWRAASTARSTSAQHLLADAR